MKPRSPARPKFKAEESRRLTALASASLRTPTPGSRGGVPKNAGLKTGGGGLLFCHLKGGKMIDPLVVKENDGLLFEGVANFLTGGKKNPPPPPASKRGALHPEGCERKPEKRMVAKANPGRVGFLLKPRLQGNQVKAGKKTRFLPHGRPRAIHAPTLKQSHPFRAFRIAFAFFPVAKGPAF